MADANRTV